MTIRHFLLLLVSVAAVVVLAPAGTADAASGFGRPAAITTGSGPSTATDRAGHTVVAFSNYGIGLASNVTGRWKTVTVTPAKPGRLDSSPSLALDRAGHAYIAFERLVTADPPTSLGIFLATNTSGHWAVTRLTSGADVSPSIAVDASNSVHVAYARTGSAAGVRYLTQTAAGWRDSLITDQGAPSDPTLKLLAGVPYVAYTQLSPVSAGRPCGVYLWRAGGTTNWVSSHYDSTVGALKNDFSDCIGFTRPQLGRATDGIHVVFSYQGAAFGLYDTYLAGGHWTSQNVDRLQFEVTSAVFAGTRIDVMTSRDVGCSSPGCGAQNGLYFFRLGYVSAAAAGQRWQWQNRQGTPPGRLTVSADTCNSTSLTSPYTCDDAPSLQVFQGHDRIAFDRVALMFVQN